MKDYLIKEDVFMALTCDITDCTIEEFIARLRDKLSKLPNVDVTTNDDCISREAVKHLLNLEMKKPILVWKKLFESVNSLPSVTPKEKIGWIPVNERVPQECIHTYDNNFHDYTRSKSVLVTIRNKVTNSVYVFHNLAYISNGEWYIDNCYDHDRFKNCSVIAWTPLPEPYKAESEG